MFIFVDGEKRCQISFVAEQSSNSRVKIDTKSLCELISSPRGIARYKNSYIKPSSISHKTI